MIGMKPKDAIKLKEVPLVNREDYPPIFLRTGCINTYYNLAKNMMTSDAEQLIGYGLRLVID